MLTRKRWTAPNYTGNPATDYANLTKSISDYLLSLEAKGSLTIDQSVVSSSVVNTVIPVEAYGAVGDGVKDDTAAMQATAAAIVTAGGGVIEFAAGKNYKVFGSTGTLFAINGANGVTVRGNGATLTSAQVNPAIGACKVFDIHGVDGFSVDNLTFIGGNTTLTLSTGEKFVLGYDGSHNARFSNLVIKDCEAGLQTDSSAASVSRGWHISNVYMEKVYYGLACYWLDDVVARGLVTRNCGRSYFPANPCNNHDIWLDSQMGGDFSDCIIKVYAKSTYSTAENTISNIKLNYRSSGKYSGTGDQDNEEACVAFDLQQFNTNTAAGHFRNIAVNFDVDCNATDQFANLLILRKYKSDGTGDNTTTRGHSVRGLTVSGIATAWNNATQNGVRLFSTTSFTTAQDWTGDTINGICLKDLVIAGSPPTDGLYVNGQGFSDSTQSLVIDNVNLDGAVTYANVTAGRIAKRGFVASNENNSDCEGSFTPGVSFGGGTTGITYTTQTASYLKRGNRVFISGYIALSSKGSSTGAAKLTGLPFTARNNNDSNSVLSAYLVGVTFANQHQHLFDLNATTVSLNEVSAAGTATNLTDADFSNTSSIFFSGTYRSA